MLNDNEHHPFRLAVVESTRKVGAFEWSISKNDTLIERSDRLFRTEVEAENSGLRALERIRFPKHPF